MRGQFRMPLDMARKAGATLLAIGDVTHLRQDCPCCARGSVRTCCVAVVGLDRGCSGLNVTWSRRTLLDVVQCRDVPLRPYRAEIALE
jgi:hypothetical protein